MSDRSTEVPPFIEEAGERVIDIARGLVGYTFSTTLGGHWASIVASYNLRLADLFEEMISAAYGDLRWSCQLLLRTIADTWLYGRYAIAGDDSLLRMFAKWNKHLNQIAEENQSTGVPSRSFGDVKQPPTPKQIATILDEREPSENPDFAALRVYGSVWKPHSDWAAHGGLSTVVNYSSVDNDQIVLRETVSSDFPPGNTATVALGLVADFTKRTAAALQKEHEIPQEDRGLLDAITTYGAGGSQGSSV